MDHLKRIFVLLLLLAPSLAAACPNCIGSQDNSSTILKMVGVFMLVPFTVCYVVVRIIRRAERNIVEK